MNGSYVKNIIRFIFLVLLQIIILNNINLGGYINPYLYVLFILLLPFETPIWLLLISGFLIGVTIDWFSNTLGMHAAATVFVAFFRPVVIRLLSAGDEFEGGIVPGIRDMGFRWFLTYSFIIILLHHMAFFYIEIFKFSEFLITFYRGLISTVFTLSLVILSQYLFVPNRKK